MKTLLLSLLAACLHINSSGKLPEPTGFAVIELFSSEGCSSCPPADALIAKIQRETTGQPVYILSFEVDYWDRLGWKDPFSDAAFSERQRQYAERFHLSSVYTPQVVVNGTKEFVGSNETLMRSTLADQLHKKRTARLSIKDIVYSGPASTCSLSYETTETGNPVTLFTALIQKSATTRVKRGENSGQALSHVQLVRSFKVTALTSGSNSKGTVTLSVPPGIHQPDTDVIAFLQDGHTGEIIAAARLNP